MIAANARFPYFTPNQLLKADQLNDLFNFLDKENRLNRIYSLGIGNVQGLEVKYIVTTDATPDKYVQLSPGVGISSDGYLFNVTQECKFRFYKVAKYSDNAFKCHDNPSNRFVGGNLEEFYELRETLTASEQESKLFFPIADLMETPGAPGTPSTPKNRCLAVVLLWALETLERAVCLNDCDELGSETLVSVKVLLAKPEIISPYIHLQNAPAEEASVAGKPPYVKRLIWECKEKNLASVFSFEELATRYFTVCNEAVPNIIAAYQKAGTEFAISLGVQDVGNSAFAECLISTLTNRYSAPFPHLDIQYFYAYLKDLVAAYVEFAESVRGIKRGGVSLPNACQFPGFIALGPLDKDCPASNTLTPFQASSLTDQDPEIYLRAKFLFARMGMMCSLSSFPTLQQTVNEIRITACRGRHLPLSLRAIPIYYNPIPTRQAWNFDLVRDDAAKTTDPADEHVNRIPSWHRVASATPPFDQHLDYDTDAFAFFRIEGHVGLRLDAVLAKIEEMRNCSNLPFDIKCVKLGRVALPSEKLTHPQFEHLENLYLDVVCDIMEMDVQFNTPLPTNLSDLVETGWQNTVQIPTGNPALDCYFELINKLFEQHQSLASEVLFSEFVKHHPGAEHLGGVPKGGTFILIYEDGMTPQLAEKVDAMRKQIDELRKAGRWDEARNLQRDIANMTGQLPERVVADMCLPYYCCSGQATASPRIEPFIFIFPKEFCKGRPEERFEVITYPGGGSLQGDAPKDGSADYLQFDGGKWYFHPGRVKVDSGTRTVKLTYILPNGASANTSVQVERKTLNAADIVIDQTGGLDYNAACEVTGRFYTLRYEGDGVRWNIHGEWKNADEKFLISVGIKETVPVEVELNGGCIGRVELNLPSCPDVSQANPYRFNLPAQFKVGENEYEIEQDTVTTPVLIDMYPPTTQLLFVPSSVTVNGITHQMKDYITNDGTPCNGRKYSLNVAGINNPNQPNLPVLPALPVGTYQFQIIIKDCTASPIANLEILKPSEANRPAPSAGGGNTTTPTVPTGGAGTNPTVPAPGGGTTTTTTTGGGGRSPAAANEEASQAEATAALLNQRLLAHKAILAELKTSSTKITSAGMSKATNFLLAQNNDPAKLNKDFKDLTVNLFSQLKAANEEKRAQLEKLLASSLHHFLDKQVALSPTKTNGDALEILQEIATKMKENKLDLGKARNDWKGEELKKTLNAKAVTEYLKAMK